MVVSWASESAGSFFCFGGAAIPRATHFRQMVSFEQAGIQWLHIM
jgi:hypothetical protein